MKRSIPLGLAGFVLLLVVAGCGGSSGSAEAFCAKLKDLGVQFAGLHDNPSRALIQQAADAAEQAVGSAPDVIKAAVKTQADAYGQWARTGDPAALESGPGAAAGDQVDAWVSSNCQQK